MSGFQKRQPPKVDNQPLETTAPATSASLMGNAAAVEQMRANNGSAQGGQGSGSGKRNRLQEWATQSLQDRFRIVEPGAERSAGNQLTQEEFEGVAAMFADIYAGRSDLRIDDDSLPDERQQAFKMGVMTDLASILQTTSGRELVNSLHDAPSRGFLRGDRKTTISQNGAGEGDPSNAFGGGDPGERGLVSYVPGEMHGPDRNLRSDVVLYHEMVHAHHAVYDSWDHDPVEAERGGVSTDVAGGVGEHEHQAVGLGEHAHARFSENRYRQERRAIGASNQGELRGDDGMAYRDRYLGFDR